MKSDVIQSICNFCTLMCSIYVCNCKSIHICVCVLKLNPILRLWVRCPAGSWEPRREFIWLFSCGCCWLCSRIRFTSWISSLALSECDTYCNSRLWYEVHQSEVGIVRQTYPLFEVKGCAYKLELLRRLLISELKSIIIIS